MTTIKLLVAFILAFVTLSVEAQTLWRNTTVGMSPDEVRRLIPGVVATRGKPAVLKNGEVALLRIERFDFLEEAFSAEFFFAKSKLVLVTLSPHNNTDPINAMHLFEFAFKALTTEYGKAIKRDVSQLGLATFAEARWVSGATEISLLHSRVNDYMFSNINYRASAQPAAPE